jgi:carbamoyltransferase
MTDWVLALGGSNHDFSCALMRGHDIVVGIEEERLSRRKHGQAHFYENPVLRSMRYCLDAGGITLDDVSAIVSSDLLPARVRYELGNRPPKLYPHHLCHAASVAMLLPPRSTAAILIYDGAGSILAREPECDGMPARNRRETFTFYLYDPPHFHTLGQTTGTGVFEADEFPISLTNSIGLLYEFVTALIGFHHMDAGKTMGLAAHGTPRHLPLFMQFVRFGNTPDDCFACDIENPALRDALEGVLADSGGSFAAKADLAASVQELVNRTLAHCVSLFGTYDYDWLCLAGGCALNTVATSALIETQPKDVPVRVPAHSGDAGLAFGALLLYALEREPSGTALTFRGGALYPDLARPGRRYSCEETLAAAARFYPRLAQDASVSRPADLARLLATGDIIGIVNGASEIGPRALGGRSILADPRKASTRETINRRIKGREPFRPLAPIVLASAYETFFTDPRQADSCMLKVARANDHCRRVAPSVVHVDGTARVQIVDEVNGDPFLIELLRAFADITELPMLLNTSFNRRGEPIVETPADAIEAFLAMKLDGLYLDGLYYRTAGETGVG